MRKFGANNASFEIWLQIELLASQALSAEGLVPKADFAR